MQPLIFVTGNTTKFHTAQQLCGKHGIPLKQLSMDIPEIQALDSEAIARDKALRVYEELKHPIIISDDTWMIPGLRNFPGPYMKFVNGSFTSEDWLRLTAPLTDRRIILRQIVVFQDASKQQLFYTDIEGLLLKEIRGTGIYPHTSITSVDGGKHSIAEVIAEGKGSAVGAAGVHTSWDDFCEWFTLQTPKR